MPALREPRAPHPLTVAILTTSIAVISAHAAPAPIILISIDTLRADHLSCYGYPHMKTPAIDSLAADGVLFEDHLSTVPLTLPSHSSMLTGLYPPHHGVRDNGGFYLDDGLTMVAESLRDAGYRTGGFVGAFVLDRRWGIAQGFDVYFDDFDVIAAGDVPMDFIQRRASDVIARAKPFMEGPAPFFCFLHLYDPHTPYEPPDGFKATTPFPLYDGEIAYVDAQLNSLFTWLKQKGLYDQAWIILAADHGESLGEHEETTHGFFVYRSTLRVPLIVKRPRSAGAGSRRADPTSSVDIAPTLLAAAGRKLACDGVDLFGQIAPRLLYSETFYPRFHYNWSELLSITDSRLQFIDAPRPELYNYREDPGERVNLHRGGEASAFRSEIDRIGGRGHAEPQTVDAETLEKLRSLGYARGDLPASAGPLADPKDRIGVFRRLKQAEDMVYRDQGDAALALLREVEEADPRIPATFDLQGSIHSKKGAWEAAIAAYTKSLDLLPDSLEALFGRGLARLKAGRTREAEADLQKLLGLDPRNNKALYHLADIAAGEGRHDEASGLLRRAIALGRETGPLYNLLFKTLMAAGRGAEAEDALRKGLEEDPGLPLGHFNLAVLLEERGDAAAAEREYRLEIEAAPRNEMALFNLGQVLERVGGRGAGEAAGLYRRAVEAKPEFALGHIYLARALMSDSKMIAESYDICRKGLALASDRRTQALAHFVLADICNRMGRTEEAMKELEAGRSLR